MAEEANVVELEKLDPGESPVLVIGDNTTAMIDPEAPRRMEVVIDQDSVDKIPLELSFQLLAMVSADERRQIPKVMRNDEFHERAITHYWNGAQTKDVVTGQDYPLPQAVTFLSWLSSALANGEFPTVGSITNPYVQLSISIPMIGELSKLRLFTKITPPMGKSYPKTILPYYKPRWAPSWDDLVMDLTRASFLDASLVKQTKNMPKFLEPQTPPQNKIQRVSVAGIIDLVRSYCKLYAQHITVSATLLRAVIAVLSSVRRAIVTGVYEDVQRFNHQAFQMCYNDLTLRRIAMTMPHVTDTTLLSKGQWEAHADNFLAYLNSPMKKLSLQPARAAVGTRLKLIRTQAATQTHYVLARLIRKYIVPTPVALAVFREKDGQFITYELEPNATAVITDAASAVQGAFGQLAAERIMERLTNMSRLTHRTTAQYCDHEEVLLYAQCMSHSLSYYGKGPDYVKHNVVEVMTFEKDPSVNEFIAELASFKTAIGDRISTIDPLAVLMYSKNPIPDGKPTLQLPEPINTAHLDANVRFFDTSVPSVALITDKDQMATVTLQVYSDPEFKVPPAAVTVQLRVVELFGLGESEDLTNLFLLQHPGLRVELAYSLMLIEEAFAVARPFVEEDAARTTMLEEFLKSASGKPILIQMAGRILQAAGIRIKKGSTDPQKATYISAFLCALRLVALSVAGVPDGRIPDLLQANHILSATSIRQLYYYLSGE